MSCRDHVNNPQRMQSAILDAERNGSKSFNCPIFGRKSSIWNSLGRSPNPSHFVGSCHAIAPDRHRRPGTKGRLKMLKTTQRNTLTIAALTLAMLGTTSVANADHNRGFRGRRDADVDVRAQLQFYRGHAQLNVRIKAEVEGRFLRDQYNVVLTIEPANRQHNRRLVRPLTVVIPLGRPSDIDDDEIEFKRHVNLQLPRHLARFGNSLIVNAKLVSANSGRVLESDTTFVESLRQRFPRQPRRRGPGFGGRIIW